MLMSHVITNLMSHVRKNFFSHVIIILMSQVNNILMSQMDNMLIAKCGGGAFLIIHFWELKSRARVGARYLTHVKI